MRGSFIGVVWVVCALRAFAAGDLVAQLELGAWCETTRRPAEITKLTNEEGAAHQAYRSWYASTGRILAEKVRAGQPLSDEEAPFTWLALAGYMKEAFDKGQPMRDLSTAGSPGVYVQETMEKGRALMRKGYAGGVLSEEELTALRSYRMLTEMKRTQAEVLPHQFRFMGIAPGVGDEAPDFCLPLLETVLKSSNYTDDNPQDRLAFLRPAGVERFTRLFPGYEEINGRIVAKPFAVKSPEEGYFQLSRFRGHKPVLFILANSSDVFLRVGLPTLEPMVQAYKDRVEFVLVDISYHDTFSGGLEFYGSAGGQQIVHLWSSIPEERARMAKLQYMRNPNTTLTCVIDDVYQTTRSKYHSEGGAMDYVLVGLDGKIAARSPGGWFYWDGGNYPDSILWINEIERAIQGVLSDGKVEPIPAGRKARLAERAPFVGRVAKNYGGVIKNALWFSGTVVAVDKNAQLVEVKGDRLDPAAMKGWSFIQQDQKRITLAPEVSGNLALLQKWMFRGESGETATFHLGDGVELFVNGREAEPGDVRTGDHVGIKYAPAEDGKKPIQPEHFRASR